MKREIKFRAKALATDQWAYGMPIMTNDEEIVHLLSPECEIVALSRNLGMYTGLKDESGREIYEGDIVEVQVTMTQPDSDFNEVRTLLTAVGEVVMDTNEGAWVVDEHSEDGYGDGHLFRYDRVKVLGNIHENPELLKHHEQH